MQTDEAQLRQLVSTWMNATKSGDIDTVVGLMTEDVVFLRPGKSPMNKKEFAEIAKAQSSESSPEIKGTSDIKEIQILGEWAFMWSKLSVIVTPADENTSMKREGHTLTIFRKENGTWLLARDANMLAPVQLAN